MLKTFEQVLDELEPAVNSALPGIQSLFKSKNTPFWFERDYDNLWYAFISDYDVFEHGIYPEFNQFCVPHKTLKAAVEYAQEFLTQHEPTLVRPLYRSVGKTFFLKDMPLLLNRGSKGEWCFVAQHSKKDNYKFMHEKLREVGVLGGKTSFYPKTFSSKNSAIRALLDTVEDNNLQELFPWLCKQ